MIKSFKQILTPVKRIDFLQINYDCQRYLIFKMSIKININL